MPTWRDLFRVDTYANLLSGIGVVGKDRSRATTVDVEIVTEDEARRMWQSDFLAKAAIEKIPETAFRDGGFNISIKGAGGKKLAEDINSALEEFGAVPQLVQTAKFDRAYGGGVMMPVLLESASSTQATDTTYLSKPLAEDRIVRCTAIHVFEPRELQVATWYDDILRPKYRQPKTYRLNPVGSMSGQTMEIHESRLVILDGIKISNDRTVAERNGWGDNVLTVARQTLAGFGISLGGVMNALDQFSQGVLSLEGLGEMLATDEGKKVRDRLVLMDQVKSMLRTLVISSGDKYDRRDISFAGVEPMMGMLMHIVAAALGIPVALLFGMEPAGMNATGAFDIRSFYDSVGNVRTARYQHPTERLVRLTTMLPKDGPCKGKEPEQWSVEWKPLWQQSDKEREESRKMRTDNDVALIDAGIATNDEIRAARFSGDTYSYELQLTGPAPVKEIDPEHAALLESKFAGKPRNGNEMRSIVEKALEEPDVPVEGDDEEAA